jgi:toxin-antitoxin system PIN domain toxin
MTPVEPALLDTNILVYALYQSSPHHQSSRALLDQAKQPGVGFCLAPQNLAEFYAIVTNPRRVTQPKSVDEALAAIADILALPGISLLPNPADLVARWTQLVRLHAVTGAKVFDAQLVAVMVSNGVQKIYTFNVADFLLFSGIQVVTP